jgi:hypothetical protein
LDTTKSDVETSKEDKIQIDKALQANLDRLPGLQNQSKDLLEAINAAATNEARYAATQRLLAVGLAASLSEAPKDRDQLKSVLTEKVNIRSFQQEQDGLVEKTGQTTVGKALGLVKRYRQA